MLRLILLVVATSLASAVSPDGYILIERHIEKNAGSSFREILFRNELRGLCMYWGCTAHEASIISDAGCPCYAMRLAEQGHCMCMVRPSDLCHVAACALVPQISSVALHGIFFSMQCPT